jgi:hypothetical protein
MEITPTHINEQCKAASGGQFVAARTTGSGVVNAGSRVMTLAAATVPLAEGSLR